VKSLCITFILQERKKIPIFAVIYMEGAESFLIFIIKVKFTCND
jgi:hypothetical protein